MAPPSREFECGTCWREFPAGWRARENHCNSTGHRRPRFECDTCCLNFTSENARWQHMDVMNHFEHECSICTKTWPTQEQCKNHEIEDHFYCADCNRHFQTYNNIQMHLKSRVHLGTTIICPFCKGQFSTATGLTHHVENGRCPKAPQLDRDTIYKFVRSKDPDSLISKKLIGWRGSERYEATEQAWNGSFYECYFCPRTFRTLAALNQHLSSSAHQQALYHCPNRGCGKDFTTLGAVINHLESKTCRFMRFQEIQRGIGGLINGQRLLN